MTYHGPVCDQADQGVGGDQAQADDDGIAQRLEILLVETGVHHEQEYWRYLRWASKGVFDSSVLG